MKRRNVLAVLGLSYVTLGIYMVYWLYKTRKELLAYSADKKAIPPVSLLFAPLLAIVAAIAIEFILNFAMQDSNSLSAGAIAGIIFTIIFLLALLGLFVVSFWWFYRYFRALESVTQGNDAMLLYVLWIVLSLFFLGPIWVLIAQNDLNKFIDNGYRPLKTPPAPAMGPQQAYGQQPQYPVAPQQQYGSTTPGYQQPIPPMPPMTPQPPHVAQHEHQVQHQHNHGHAQGHDQNNHLQQPPQHYQG